MRTSRKAALSVIALIVAASAHADPLLPVTIDYQDSVAFWITNKGSSPWTDCILRLNPHGFDLGYQAHLERVRPGAVIRLPLTAFVESDGTRFNPFAQKALALYINCQTTAGSASYMVDTN